MENREELQQIIEKAVEAGVEKGIERELKKRKRKKFARAVLIGAAFEAQRLPEIVSDVLDVPLHAFVTEWDIYRPE